MSTADDVRGGFAAFIKEQQELPGEATLTLAQFDHEFQLEYTNVPISEVPELVFAPRGNTGLLDAIGMGVQSFADAFDALPEDEKPGTVVAVIYTDGGENCSTEWTKAKVAELVESKKKLGWEFVFLGEDLAGVHDAHNYGMVAYSVAGQSKGSILGSMSRGVASSRAGTGYIHTTDSNVGGSNSTTTGKSSE